MKRMILTLGLLAFMLLWGAKAKANWLGLAPGDYDLGCGPTCVEIRIFGIHA